MKRWIVLAVPSLLFAAVAYGQLITGGSTGSSSGFTGLTLATPVSLMTGNGTNGSPLSVVNIPSTLLYYGTGMEADPAISSGTVAITGEHHYASLTISGTGQLTVNQSSAAIGVTIIRVAGTCSFASTATCVKEDGTNDTACAINGTALNAGIGGGAASGNYGGSGGGGGAAGATNGGANGSVLFAAAYREWSVAGATGGVVGGATPVPGSTAITSLAEATLAFNYANFVQTGKDMSGCGGCGSAGGAGGNGTGTGGVLGRESGTLILICKAFGTTTGHILLTGQKGGAGTSCGNAGGGGGGGTGILIVAGPGGYPAGNLDLNGGVGGAGCAGGQAGAPGGKGVGWDCDTAAGTCTQL